MGHREPRRPLPVTPLVGEERRELDVPFAKHVVTDCDPGLLKQCLSVWVAQRKAVVQLSGHAR